MYVESLLKKKANPNHQNKYNETALIKASRLKNNETVAALLKYPTHVNTKNKNGDDALSIAIHNRNNNITSQLIWAGADIASNPAKYIETNEIPQINAIGDFEIATEQNEKRVNSFLALAHLGFNLDQTNENGDTFLMHFIKEGYLSNYKAILNCSVNVNQKDIDGNSPLMLTIGKNNIEYLNILLSKKSGFNFTETNNNNLNSFDLAIQSNSIEKIELLISYCNKIDSINATKIHDFLNEHHKDSKAITLLQEKSPELFHFDVKFNRFMFNKDSENEGITLENHSKVNK